jgi:hypothetical protein
MKTFPLFLGAGLLSAGFAVGCADSSTDAPTASNPPAADVPGQPTWVADAGVTKARLKVTGMT